jgi:hypothetical protein
MGRRSNLNNSLPIAVGRYVLYAMRYALCALRKKKGVKDGQ